MPVFQSLNDEKLPSTPIPLPLFLILVPWSIKLLASIVSGLSTAMLEEKFFQDERLHNLSTLPLTSPDNYCIHDNSSYSDTKRAKLGLEIAAPVRRTVLEYPIVDFSQGTRIFTDKVSVRNIPVTLPTAEYEMRKRTRSIKFADEIREELSVGGGWKQVAGASSL